MVLCSSAASSTPVAPAPTMAMSITAPSCGVVGAEAGVHQAAVEEVRLPGVVDGEGVLAHARRAEVVRLAADRDHQRVVGDAPLGQDLARPRRRFTGADARSARAARSSPARAPEREGEVVPARLREVVELVVVHVHAAGCDLVQQRLPQVRAAAVDERHLRPGRRGRSGRRAAWRARARRRRRPPRRRDARIAPSAPSRCSRLEDSAPKILPLEATMRPLSRNLSSPSRSPTRPAGLADQQRAGRHVPRRQADLPEAVAAARRDPREVERRGARAAHARQVLSSRCCSIRR